jgi:hypothetical protein
MNRKSIKLYLLFSVILAGLAPALFAQEKPLQRAGTIVHATGGGFEIIRSGIRRSYDPSIDYVEGSDIFYGDHINTFKSSFIEILLEPGDRLIRVSEQTSFSVPDAMRGRDGGASIDLTYGRIRARVQRLVQGRSFEMRGPSAAAGVRGTDFGYDILAIPAGKEADSLAVFPESNIYCLEGTIVVSPLAEDNDQGAITLSAGEMVVEKDKTGFHRKALDQDLIDFWETNAFVTFLPFSEETEKPETTDPEAPRITWKQSEYRKAALVTGIGGALLVGSGAAISYFQGNTTIPNALYIPGGIFLSTSLLSLILSLTAD